MKRLQHRAQHRPETEACPFVIKGGLSCKPEKSSLRGMMNTMQHSTYASTRVGGAETAQNQPLSPFI